MYDLRHLLQGRGSACQAPVPVAQISRASGELGRMYLDRMTSPDESRSTSTSFGAEDLYDRLLGDRTEIVWVQKSGHLIEELGWTREEAAEVRSRLLSFAAGWDAPGMEAYDDL